VTEVSNQSAGYCPDPASWPAVSDALDRAGLEHPGRFTHPVVFRRCPRCQERNLVKDDYFACVICGAELPRTWNVDPLAIPAAPDQVTPRTCRPTPPAKRGGMGGRCLPLGQASRESRALDSPGDGWGPVSGWAPRPATGLAGQSPPATVMSLPVTYDASGEISHDTAFAISSGRPILPSGLC